MTRPLLRLALILFCLTLAGVLAAHVRGQGMASPVTSILAGNGCALPCLFGITPGQTTAEAALAQLRTLKGIQVPAEAMFSFIAHDAAGREAVGLLYLDAETGQRIIRIQLSPVDTFVSIAPLSDLLLSDYAQAVGAPRVFRTCNGMLPRRMQFIFGENAELVAEIFPLGSSLDSPLQPGIPLLSIRSNAPGAENLQAVQSDFGCGVEVGWHGFAPLWHYFGRGQ